MKVERNGCAWKPSVLVAAGHQLALSSDQHTGGPHPNGAAAVTGASVMDVFHFHCFYLLI